MKWFMLILLLIPVVLYSQETKEELGKIEVKVSNLRNANGAVYLFLYNYENQYPKNPYHHYKIPKQSIKEGVVSFQIPEELKYGKYAITLIDDENENENLDKKYGIPTEGYGFSNNQKPLLFLLPEYRELLFDLDAKTVVVQLEVQYL